MTEVSKVSEEDFNQWASNEVTKAVINRLIEAQNSAISSMLNADPNSFESLEQYAMHCATLRMFVDGLGQATDIESAKADLVNDIEEVAIDGY